MGQEDVRKELRLALDKTTGSALFPESLEKHIVELVKIHAPTVDLLTVRQADSAVQEYVRTTSVPLGRFEGELASQALQSSTNERVQLPLKIIRRGGSVAGFTDAASRKFVDAYEREIVLATRGIAATIECGNMFGNADADQYQYTGFDPQIKNRFDADAVASLDILDAMIDEVHTAGGTRHDKVFFMSPKMLSKFSRLDETIRRTIAKTEYAGGIRMASYRGANIIEAPYLKPSAKMGPVTAADGGVAGTLSAGADYRYRVAAVTLTGGETYASDITTHTAPAAPNSSIKLSWAAVDGAILYKIYRDNGGGEALTLLTTIAALTYDANGTPTGTVTEWTDTGAIAYNANADRPLDKSDGDEIIFLIDLDPDEAACLYGLRSTTGEKLNNLVVFEELAKTKDSRDFMLKAYLALAVKNEYLHAVTRRVRLA